MKYRVTFRIEINNANGIFFIEELQKHLFQRCRRRRFICWTRRERYVFFPQDVPFWRRYKYVKGL